MTPVSLMPPVDYCSSCEGRKAESKATQIGEARARQAELETTFASPEATVTGATSPAEVSPVSGTERPQQVANAVQSLLAPDLAVQASLARPTIETGNGAAEALRLQASQAYRTL